MKEISCYEIVLNYLKENGYDGLYDPEYPCGCSIHNDFMPCDSESFNRMECLAGYKRPMTKDELTEHDIDAKHPGAFCIGPKEEK